MTLTINPPSPRVRGAVTPASKPVNNTPPLPVLSHVVQHVDNEAPILKHFMYGIGYHPPNISGTNERLETAMRSEMHEREIQCAQLERTLHLAASFIELTYPRCTFEEKKNIAMYNWLAIYVDDMAAKDAALLGVFELRFLRGLPQLHPVLQAFAETIIPLCDQYDTLTANIILTATFDFVNSTCVEHVMASMPLVRDAKRFPWYLRDQTGIGKAFGLFGFSKSTHIHITDYIQALPDINYWICAVNDFLSFHKEELAGETGNYVHNRAYMEDCTPMQVLSDIGHELLEVRASIFAVLAKSPRALEAWENYERGYIAWHLSQDRYKLKDLGL